MPSTRTEPVGRAGAAPLPTRPTTLRRRLPIMVLGVISLLAALWGGLLLLGLDLPTLRSTTASDHGPLMTLGFLGTVISLERAVALRKPWGFAAPILAGLGGLGLVAGIPGWVSWALLCASSVVLICIYVAVFAIAVQIHLVAMALAAVSWYGATVLWLGGRDIPRVVPWLTGFLVLTILGERLELARVALLTKASVRSFLVATVVFLVGLVVTVPSFALGVRVAGVGMIALALWGARYDVARKTIKTNGVTQFMAACLLSGYVWLLVSGLMWAVVGDLGRSAATYDAALHAVFLGFVMSMIFGHAPVIVPAVLGVRLPFAPRFYAHLALLHVALAVRLIGGDLLGNKLAWQIGGTGTVIAILLFLAVSAHAVVTAARGRKK